MKSGPIFDKLRDDDINVLAVLLAFGESSIVTIKGVTGYNAIRIQGPLRNLKFRELIREFNGVFELTDEALVVAWFRANKPELLPGKYRQ